jgi:hypothetical protein
LGLLKYRSGFDIDLIETFEGGYQLESKRKWQLSPQMRALQGNGGGILINKALARNLGLDAAIVYSALVNKCDFLRNTGQIPNGEFYYTELDMENDTSLSGYKQRLAIKVLLEYGLIREFRKGDKGIRHFTITSDLSIFERALAYSIDQVRGRGAKHTFIPRKY